MIAGLSALLHRDPDPDRAHGRVSRAVWHTIGLVLAALLAYAVWRGYQNPDLLLDLGAFRLC
ncbi:MAG: hypothetical protein ABI886_11760 [Betaproteobacteria bacterium]